MNKELRECYIMIVVLMLCVITLVVTHYASEYCWRKTAIQLGHARYNPTTSNFEWITNTVVNPK